MTLKSFITEGRCVAPPPFSQLQGPSGRRQPSSGSGCSKQGENMNKLFSLSTRFQKLRFSFADLSTVITHLHFDFDYHLGFHTAFFITKFLVSMQENRLCCDIFTHRYHSALFLCALSRPLSGLLPPSNSSPLFSP